MKRISWLVGGAAAVLGACSIYGPDLVGSGGSGGTSGSSSSSAGASTGSSTATNSSSATSSSTTNSSATSSSTSTSSSTASSGMPPCTDASACPGVDTECSTRTCTAGVCGTSDAAAGMVLVAQTQGDCKQVQCDGMGGTKTVNDDTDVLDDMNDCTTDGCSAGVGTHAPLPSGTMCTSSSGKVCNAAGKCVECVSAADCPSQVCKTSTNTCVAAACNDMVKNGAESDVDCGGGMCPACGFGKSCGTSNDCVGLSCVSGKCAATCTDGEKDGAETDIDCGGSTCPACPSGKACGTNNDCKSGKCSGGVCTDVLLISELQTRGDASGSDEFIEIYNPMSIAATFDASWTIWARNAASQPCAALNKRLTGAGQVIPPHGHLLFANSGGYNAGVTPDVTYTTGFTDSGQVVLLHGSALADQLCYYFNTATQTNLTCATPPAMWFPCQGMVSNSPHNDTTGGSSNSDLSLERKPGGAAGNGQNTGDNLADFDVMVAPSPQNLASAPTP